MKLNARDKAILIGLVCVIIVIAGIFGLIKPKMGDIETDEAKLKEVKAQWEQIEDKIAEIEPMQKEIKDDYSDAVKLSNDFVDESQFFDKDENFMTYKLDQFMQPYINECELEASRIEIGTHTSKTLSYYYFEPDVLTTSMFDAADVNGDYREELNDRMEESNSLSQRNAEEVIVTQFGLAAKGTKENIWNFMTKINSLNTAILIESVNIADYTFGEANLEPGQVSDNKSDVTFVINLYSVFEMDEPVVDE
ncbi:MAG: hypothetical protein ACI4JE_08370 [Ruminococcus sp.]|nr:hypothetical protein [Oscillospiraceae bacterium]